ncbi:MAG: hypothetical protein ABWJ42_00250 [Sulfolobales archaeon]
MLSQDKIELLKSLWAQGVSVREISKILGVNPRSLYVYIRVLKLKPRKPGRNVKLGERDLEIIRELALKGVKIREIARRFNVSSKTITMYLRAMGVEYRSVSRCPEIPRDELLKLAQEGLRDIDIAKRFNTTISCVSKYKRVYGISKRKFKREATEKRLQETIERILEILRIKGFTTSVELRQNRIILSEKILERLAERDSSVKWFKIKYTSTSKFTVLPARLGGVTAVYKDLSKVSEWLYNQIVDKNTPARVIRYLFKLNKIPQEITDRILGYTRIFRIV